jgi:hypothetical protein
MNEWFYIIQNFTNLCQKAIKMHECILVVYEIFLITDLHGRGQDIGIGSQKYSLKIDASWCMEVMNPCLKRIK